MHKHCTLIWTAHLKRDHVGRRENKKQKREETIIYKTHHGALYVNSLFIYLPTVLSLKLDITADYVAPSTGVDLLVLRSVLSPNEGALHPQQAEHKAQHAQGESRHQQASHDLDGAWRHKQTSSEPSAERFIGQRGKRVTYLRRTRARGSRNSC